MSEPFLSDKDLHQVVKVLMPGYADASRMVLALKEDEDILEGMLCDERLFRFLTDNPESFLQVSPALFFTVLLNKVRQELEARSWTVERGERHLMIVFDSREVVELLHDRRLRNYLAGMLASFVRINSYSVTFPVRKGIWKRLRFSDFDLDSLVRYSRLLDEEERFPAYRRIADVCLFLAGVFPDAIDPREISIEGLRPELRVQDHWEKVTRQGEYYYREAARQRAARLWELGDVLNSLSEKFTLATKPLTILANRYLQSLRQQYFLQDSPRD